jgi:membrane associated rhomboid family serine protease
VGAAPGEITLDTDWVIVFRGSQEASLEFALVLDARGVRYDRVETDAAWSLWVEPAQAQIAQDELARYAAERIDRREAPPSFTPFGGSAIGALLYAGILLATAYCVGIQLFNADWLASGALDSRSGAGGEWWRAVTALTLHLDQEHLLGNLLFGAGVGILAGRMFGPGIAWLAILAAGAVGNYLDMLISPASHRAVGASTAVFAALGLLAGFAWRQRPAMRNRRVYRWAPLFAGVCLLALLGAGDEHVDVLGHLLGFSAGVVLGALFAGAGMPRSRGRGVQIIAGVLALLLVAACWAVALLHTA